MFNMLIKVHSGDFYHGVAFVAMHLFITRKVDGRGYALSPTLIGIPVICAALKKGSES